MTKKISRKAGRAGPWINACLGRACEGGAVVCCRVGGMEMGARKVRPRFPSFAPWRTPEVVHRGPAWVHRLPCRPRIVSVGNAHRVPQGQATQWPGRNHVFLHHDGESGAAFFVLFVPLFFDIGAKRRDHHGFFGSFLTLTDTGIRPRCIYAEELRLPGCRGPASREEFCRVNLLRHPGRWRNRGMSTVRRVPLQPIANHRRPPSSRKV